MAASSEKFDSKESLSEIFNKGFEIFNCINQTKESTSSPKVQSDIKMAMQIFEEATKLVSLVDMFSTNENIEEIPTENIKYFLLPALLGSLTTKICGAEDRMRIVDVAEIYFIDYIKRLVSYGLTNIKVPETSRIEKEETTVERHKSNAEMITEMVNIRNTKIHRYTEQKELESRLQILKQGMDDLNIDEESKREYYSTLLKIYLNQVLDELSSLTDERLILEHMKKVDGGEKKSSHFNKSRIPATQLKPVIITRDAIQKQVYGAGYPSLPVLTVQEFYDQRVKDGDWPTSSQRNKVNTASLQDIASNEFDSLQDKEDEEKETKIEHDDEELLNQSRALDEYKDTHRRGWGNRSNRS